MKTEAFIREYVEQQRKGKNIQRKKIFSPLEKLKCDPCFQLKLDPKMSIILLF